MKFEGTQQAVEITQGAQSNTYDTIGNADVSFRRNTIDFMYLRNGWSKHRFNIIFAKWQNWYNWHNKWYWYALQKNGVDFFKPQGPNIVANGPENLLLVEDGNVSVSSSWVFANTFGNRTAESDTDFRGCISGGLASGTVYMTYEHVPERLHI